MQQALVRLTECSDWYGMNRPPGDHCEDAVVGRPPEAKSGLPNRYKMPVGSGSVVRPISTTSHRLLEMCAKNETSSSAMCLGLPVLVRTLAVFTPVFVIGVLIQAAVFDGFAADAAHSIPLSQVVVSVALLFSYFSYLARKIGQVAPGGG